MQILYPTKRQNHRIIQISYSLEKLFLFNKLISAILRKFIWNIALTLQGKLDNLFFLFFFFLYLTLSISRGGGVLRTMQNAPYGSGYI